MNLSATQTPPSTIYTCLSKSASPNNNRNRRLLEIRPLRYASTKDKTGMGIAALTATTMRDRSKNRKPLQRGRNLSIEAIQTVQALKRANNNNNDVDKESSLEHVFDSKVRRLLKLDMIAVLRELLRQNECLLALKVFEDIRKEYWYKPQVSVYAEIITALGSNRLLKKVDCLFIELKRESSLEPDIQCFNALFESLLTFNSTKLAMEAFYFMKSIGGEPDKSTFTILIKGLESNGETSVSAILRREAQKYYGESLSLLDEEEEMAMS
ncbi:unnamed protein product [Ilex paraguariensis]|uniref:Pentatricopeptide repeat-containing protein n=1 Tax=Ilex paraguariensis TaxID=185542 RepID=A0ABC8R5D7_9AQUA